MRGLVLLLFIISSVAFGCPSGGGDSINVSGIVITQTFPGPPNYESIKNGDRPETYWMLKLDKPMCFSPDSEFMSSKVSLKLLQLLLYRIKGNIHLIKGSKYEFTGITVPAQTTYHKTEVMLEVKTYKKL